MKRIIPLLAAIFILLGLFLLNDVTPQQSVLSLKLNLQREEKNSGEQPAGDNQLLPDLQTLPPSEMYIQATGNARKLRFDTSIINRGHGPLELTGKAVPENEVTAVTQAIQTKDGGIEEKVVGEFILHPTHDHWHFEEFTEFELWSYGENGELEELLATTGKISFCIRDTSRAEDFPGSPGQEVYDQCEQDIQGISVGWIDTYSPEVEGQELDISGIPNGRYAVRSTADPNNKILETDNDNNSTTVFIELNGRHVQIINPVNN